MGFDPGKPVSITLYTGLADLQPLLINPSKEELSAVGVELKDDPTYVDSTVAGNRRVRIDVWCAHDSINTLFKVTFFIEDTERESQATPGNFQFINEFGDSTWGASADELKVKYDWFKGEIIRKAKAGEADFVLFIKRWFSIGRGQQAKIDDIQSLISGNVSYFRTLLKNNPTRKVQCLLTIREYEGNYYQNVFNRYFSGAGTKNVTYWKKALEGVTTPINYQNSFILKEFNPISAAEKSSESPEVEDPWAK